MERRSHGRIQCPLLPRPPQPSQCPQYVNDGEIINNIYFFYLAFPSENAYRVFEFDCDGNLLFAAYGNTFGASFLDYHRVASYVVDLWYRLIVRFPFPASLLPPLTELKNRLPRDP